MKKIDKIISSIKNAGFSHIKVELEASMYRSSSDQRYSCRFCKGTGNGPCMSCDERGVIISTDTQGRQLYADCQSCRGAGQGDCKACSGVGSASFSNENICRAFLLSNIKKSSVKKIVYGKFYYDGSVDSEYTFTVAIEDAPVVIEVIQAWNKMFGAMHGGSRTMDTRGAGMHIAVLPEGCNGKYPSPVRLDADGWDNFKTQVSTLLPTMYFLAASKSTTRPLQFRMPQISESSKYSAVYARNTSQMEFRIFDTCYDDPNIFYDYLSVIGNSLKFYADPTLKVKKLGLDFRLRTGDLSKCYNSLINLRVLNAQIKYLKPEGKSYKVLRKERALTMTLKMIQDQNKKRAERLEPDYRYYSKTVDIRKRQITATLSKSAQDTIDSLMAVENMTYEQALDYYLTINHGVRKLTLSEYIDQAVSSKSGNLIRV